MRCLSIDRLSTGPGPVVIGVKLKSCGKSSSTVNVLLLAEWDDSGVNCGLGMSPVGVDEGVLFGVPLAVLDDALFVPLINCSS